MDLLKELGENRIGKIRFCCFSEISEFTLNLKHKEHAKGLRTGLGSCSLAHVNNLKLDAPKDLFSAEDPILPLTDKEIRTHRFVIGQFDLQGNLIGMIIGFRNPKNYLKIFTMTNITLADESRGKGIGFEFMASFLKILQSHNFEFIRFSANKKVSLAFFKMGIPSWGVTKANKRFFFFPTELILKKLSCPESMGIYSYLLAPSDYDKQRNFITAYVDTHFLKEKILKYCKKSIDFWNTQNEDDYDSFAASLSLSCVLIASKSIPAYAYSTGRLIYSSGSMTISTYVNSSALASSTDSTIYI